MSLFKKSQKSPAEVVKSLVVSLALLKKHKGEKKAEKASEDVLKYLQSMKMILYGTENHEPNAEMVAQLAQEAYNNQLFQKMIEYLPYIDFEGKKDTTQIFNNLLRRQIGTRNPTVDYILLNSDIITELVEGYDSPDIALHCGQMLRECLRHEPLAKVVLDSDLFYKFFNYVEVSTFDIASDAFSTFKDLLTRFKILCEQFLNLHYEKFFEKYTKLLNSENYVTRRQSLKLLGELLLDRHNFTIMTRYISSPDNLKLIMNCLRDRSKNIQFEAFHVFKVFVANPKKSQPILDILIKNQQKLLEFLPKFHSDRTDDEQFNDEKAYLIKQIKELKPVAEC